MRSRVFGLSFSLLMLIASISSVRVKDGMDELPAISVLALEGTFLYDSSDSDDEDYPSAIPVWLSRVSPAGKWGIIRKTASATTSGQDTSSVDFNPVAPSQLGFYHRHEILRI